MDITVQELKQKKDKGEKFVLIDVREVHENNEFNIGGQLIPLGQVMQSLDDLQDYKNEEVIVYCRSGARSGMAQNILQSAGFKNVRNLSGGVIAWAEAFGT